MESTAENAFMILLTMSTQYLDRYNQRIGKQVLQCSPISHDQHSHTLIFHATPTAALKCWEISHSSTAHDWMTE